MTKWTTWDSESRLLSHCMALACQQHRCTAFCPFSWSALKSLLLLYAELYVCPKYQTWIQDMARLFPKEINQAIIYALKIKIRWKKPDYTYRQDSAFTRIFIVFKNILGFSLCLNIYIYQKLLINSTSSPFLHSWCASICTLKLLPDAQLLSVLCSQT